jgi:hypothetical protein
LLPDPLRSSDDALLLNSVAVTGFDVVLLLLLLLLLLLGRGNPREKERLERVFKENEERGEPESCLLSCRGADAELVVGAGVKWSGRTRGFRETVLASEKVEE